MDADHIKLERLIAAALKQVDAGHYTVALRLLKKAHRLRPDSRTEQLQARIQNIVLNLQNVSEHDTSSETDMATASSNNEPYSEGQLDLVERVYQAKDLYEVLHVPPESTAADIKKAYKNLALRLHPDKNQAPGSAEAFKLVGNAFAVLSDEPKRIYYDQQRTAPNTLRHRTQSTRESAGRSFSYRNFVSDHYYAYHHAGGYNPYGLSRFAPVFYATVFLVVLMILFVSFFLPDRLYSLRQSRKYPVGRITKNLSIPYFVKGDFDMDYQGSITELEESIEQEFVQLMRNMCFQERHIRQTMMTRARNFGSRLQFVQAQEMKTPSCDYLYKIGIKKFSLH